MVELLFSTVFNCYALRQPYDQLLLWLRIIIRQTVF